MLGYWSHDSPRDVIFVHGAGCNNLIWANTAKGLSGRSKALAVNLPGHPEGEIVCRSIGDYAEAIRSFIAEAGLRRPALCGHSMGGAIALTLAIAHPEVVGGLVLVGTGAKLGVDQNIIEGLGSNPMRTIEKLITPRSFSAIDIGLGREARTALSLSNLPVFLNDYLACQGFDVRRELSKISTGTLLICGEKDRMTPPKWSHFLGAQILGSDLRFIKDSGHAVPLEKPGPLSALVQSFLGGLSR